MSTFVEFTGPAKLDRQTKRLTRRLKPGDIAIIDHRDIDRVSAEELVDSGARVVVNCASSQTGRFPNPGPLLLVRGGVRLIDVPGAELFDAVSEGELISVRGSSVFRNGDMLASGRTLTADDLGFDESDRAALDTPLEKREIESAILTAQGSVSRAAEALGISRQALYRRMEKLGIVIERRPK